VSEGNIYVRSLIDTKPKITNAGCSGEKHGKIELEVANATEFQYTWSNKQTGSAIENLQEGSYSVNISSKEGCFWTISNMTIERREALDINVFVPISSDSGVIISVSEGHPPYRCKINDFPEVIATNGLCTFANLSRGIELNLTVHDNSSCEYANKITISGKTSPTIGTVTLTTYFGVPEGSVVGIAFGIAGFFVLLMVAFGILIRKGKLPAFFPLIYRRKYARVAPNHSIDVIPMKET